MIVRTLLKFAFLISQVLAFVSASANVASTSLLTAPIAATQEALVKVETNCRSGDGFYFANEGEVYVMTNYNTVIDVVAKNCVVASLLVKADSMSGSLPAVLAFADPIGDFAILKLFDTTVRPNVRVVPLLLDSASPKLGQQFVAWGSSVSKTNRKYETGAISQLVQLRVPVIEVPLSLEAAISGNPVINAKTGQVLGMMTAQFDHGDAQAAVLNQSLAINVNYIRSIVTGIDWREVRALPIITPEASVNPPTAVANLGRTSPWTRSSEAWIKTGFDTALLRASALLPGIYGCVVAVWLLLAGKPLYFVAYGAAGYGLILVGDLIFRSGSFMSAGLLFPYMIGPCFALVGVSVITHLLFRGILATIVYSTNGTAFQTRTERTATGMLFKPWVSIAFSIPLLFGAWVWVAYDMVWKAGN